MRRLWALLVVGLLALTGAVGCAVTDEPAERVVSQQTGPALDPEAKLITIDDAKSADSASVYLSRAAGHRVQWKNDGKDTVYVAFKRAESPLAIPIPPGEYSPAFPVSQFARNDTYEYQIADYGPPQPPQIEVGP